MVGFGGSVPPTLKNEGKANEVLVQKDVDGGKLWREGEVVD
jgi:hypothetical protein